MKPAAFEYFRPNTLADALALLDRLGDDARVISGGQSLVPMMNLRLAQPAYLIDLSAIAELSGILTSEGRVRIGAMTRQRELLTDNSDLAKVPLMRLAAKNIGHAQTRNRGTVGGSLANADPAAEISLTMVTLDATILVESVAGERAIKARDFFIDAMLTAIEPNEIVTAVLVPIPAHTPKCSFKEIARRHGDFALASVAVQHCPVSNAYSVGIGAVATTPRHCERINAQLADGPASYDVIHQLVELEFGELSLLDDSAASADYRKAIAAELVLDCLDGLRSS